MMLAISILALGLLILIHEAGHFALARACGMRVDTFSIGFGPALLSFHGKSTEYRLSLLPLGGYVRIAGMAPGDGTPADDPKSFANRPAWQRFLVIAAGPAVNWAFAVAALTTLFTIGYQVHTGRPVIEKVVGAPAFSAGLMRGDRVLEIDGQPIDDWRDLSQAIAAHKDRQMEMKIRRNEQELTLTARPGPDGTLGIIAESRLERHPIDDALGIALVRTWDVVADTFGAIGQFVRRTGSAQLMGPVGIVSQTAEAASHSSLTLLAVMVQISMVLALMNLLPLPALDGGRLLFILLAMIRRRPVDAKIEAVVHGIGLVLLLGLLLIATYGDIGRLLKGREPAPTPPSSGGSGAAPAAPPQPVSP